MKFCFLKIGELMGLRNAMEEAFHRGEKIKDQIISDVMHSQAVNDLLQNEVFLKSLTRVMNTKYELKKAFRTNLKSVLKLFNLPSRDEINVMERKLNRLENEIDGIQRKVLTSRLQKTHSLKKSKSKTGK